LVSSLEKLKNDEDVVVSESAEWALARLQKLRSIEQS
jgi:HEAT repeat protein